MLTNIRDPRCQCGRKLYRESKHYKSAIYQAHFKKLCPKCKIGRIQSELGEILKYYKFEVPQEETPTKIRNINLDSPYIINKYRIEEYSPCVYFLYSGLELVYIGQTKNLPLRIEQHKKDKLFDRVYYLTFPASDKHTTSIILNNVEVFYIQKYSPKYNKSGTL